jgi:hypothetical protein
MGYLQTRHRRSSGLVATSVQVETVTWDVSLKVAVLLRAGVTVIWVAALNPYRMWRADTYNLFLVLGLDWKAFFLVS